MTIPHKNLPHFLLIGAMKARTTWLCSMISQSKNIFIPPRKELYFFGGNAKTREEVDEYSRHFENAPDGAIIGEGTVHYLPSPNAAQQVKKILGQNVKFIVCLRSPASRAYSHYLHRYRDLAESRPFHECLGLTPRYERQAERITFPNVYFSYSCYARNLESWLRVFPVENFLFLINELDFEDDKDLCGRICNFLSVPHFQPRRLSPANRARLPRIVIHKKDIEFFLNNHHIRKIHAPSVEVRWPRRVTIHEDLSFLPKGNLQYYSRFTKNIDAGEEIDLVSYFSAWNRYKPKALSLDKDLASAINAKIFSKDITETEKIVGRDLGVWLQAEGAGQACDVRQHLDGPAQNLSEEVA